MQGNKFETGGIVDKTSIMHSILKISRIGLEKVKLLLYIKSQGRQYGGTTFNTNAISQQTEDYLELRWDVHGTDRKSVV